MVCVASYGHLKKVSQNFVKFWGLFVKNCKKWVVFQKKENEKAAKAEKKCESDFFLLRKRGTKKGRFTRIMCRTGFKTPMHHRGPRNGLDPGRSGEIHVPAGRAGWDCGTKCTRTPDLLGPHS
jgi:hypothetical protein